MVGVSLLPGAQCGQRDLLYFSHRTGTAERNFVWGGYSPFLKSLLCAKLKSTIYGKIIGGGGMGTIAPLAPLLRGPCRRAQWHTFIILIFSFSILCTCSWNSRLKYSKISQFPCYTIFSKLCADQNRTTNKFSILYVQTWMDPRPLTRYTLYQFRCERRLKTLFSIV